MIDQLRTDVEPMVSTWISNQLLGLLESVFSQGFPHKTLTELVEA